MVLLNNLLGENHFPNIQTHRMDAIREPDTQSWSNEDIEIQLLLEGIYLKYGYDFRDYARSSIKRQVLKRLSSAGMTSLLEMLRKVLDDSTFVTSLLKDFSITFSAIFRDPAFYRIVREQVLPILRTYPEIKIWHAGCATGEEVFSLAIILKEEEIYDRTVIYATDFNETAIEQARQGMYPLNNLQKYTDNYIQSGGKGEFSQYYTTTPSSLIMSPSLLERVTFRSHNLATDDPFDEVHLIFARNVLVYFNERLQYRAFRLFYQSLCSQGFLCLGTDEHLRFSLYADFFDNFMREERIYRRKIRAWNMPK